MAAVGGWVGGQGSCHREVDGLGLPCATVTAPRAIGSWCKLEQLPVNPKHRLVKTSFARTHPRRGASDAPWSQSQIGATLPGVTLDCHQGQDLPLSAVWCCLVGVGAGRNWEQNKVSFNVNNAKQKRTRVRLDDFSLI